jgi:ParB-like chromosome segregation protein Spo0J
VQLDENLKRADLSPLEVAGGYQRLLDLGRTMDQVCERAGKKRSAVYARCSC